MTHHGLQPKDYDGYRRRYDDMSFIRKNWQIIIVFAVFISGYSVLSWSVRDHHDIDNARDSISSLRVSQAERDIVSLREIVKSIPRIEDKLDMVIMRLPRKN
jgi:Tfp pilus assembly protein PilO